MDCWASGDDVILVDATAPNGTPGQIQIWNACADKLPEDVFPCSTHGFGVREAVELARVLGRLPLTLLIYGIEGKRFSLGATVSPEVDRAVESVAQEILERAPDHGRSMPKCAEAHDRRLAGRTFCCRGIDYRLDLGDVIGRKLASPGMFPNDLGIGCDIDAVDFVIRDITLNPLNLRPQGLQHSA